MKTLQFIFILGLAMLSPASVSAQWTQQLPSPTTEKLLEVKFINDSTGFIGGLFGTILKTSDLGNTWVQVNSSITFWGINSFFFWNDQKGCAVGGNSYYLTTNDGGDNWSSDTISYILDRYGSICFRDSLTGFIASLYYEMLKTTDAGNNWDTVSFPSYYGLDYITFDNHSVGFATGMCGGNGPDCYAGEGLIMRSLDGGENWDKVYNGPVSPPVNEKFYEIAFTDSLTWYAVGFRWEDMTPDGEILKTTDGGNTWSIVYSNYSYDGEGRLKSVFFVNDSTGYCAGNGPILKTTDAGASWTLQWGAYNTNSVWFANDSVGFAVGDNGGIYRTSNGGENWINQYSDEGNNILVYPNPVSGEFTVDISGIIGAPDNIDLSIFDIIGNLSVHENISDLVTHVDISELATGTYILKFLVNKSVYIKTIVVSNN